MVLVSASGPSGPLYVYGLCLASEHRLDFPSGIAGEVGLITVDALAAVVEDNIDLDELQGDNSRLLTAVLSHDRVLCHLFQQVPLLPLRFGTQFPSLDLLRAYLTQEQTVYQAKLLALADRAEYQIKLIPADLDPPPLPEGLKGRDYFLAKKQRLQALSLAQQQQQEERQRLLAAIATTYAEAVVDESTAETKIYLLIPKSQAETLTEALGRWQAESPRWQIGLSAALPPYHFV